MKLTYSKFLLFFCAFLFIGCIANAQNTSQQNNVNAASLQGIQPENQSATNEISLLKAQNELLKQNNKDLLTTVQWTINTFIAIVISVVVVVIGLGWYTNFRAYDKDYKNLVRDMNSELDSIRSLIKNNNEISKEVMSFEFSKFKLEMSEKYYNWQSEEIQKQRELNKETYEIIDTAIDTRMMSIDYLISDVNYKFAVIQSEQSLENGLLEDALSIYAEAIGNKQGSKNYSRTHELLLKIETILEDNEKQLSNHIIKKIKKNLDEVSDQYKYEVEHIKELLQVKKNKNTDLQISETDADSNIA